MSPRSLIQYVLLSGLILSVLILLIGMAMKLLSQDLSAPAVGLYDLARADIGFTDRLMAFGVLVLAFTPVTRVLLLVILWGIQRDWIFMGVALFVLATLASSIFFSF